MQLSHAFRDIGWITMSDQTDNSDRILLTFKSSPYGSFNHSHADQNSFVLHAYGSMLAINSGYYDAYHSKHDSGFTRKTHAHNSITLFGKGGQKDDDMFANGHLTSYLTHPEFDLAGGDATAAYKGKIKKYQRNIIYIRPEIFITLDDLQAADGEREEFLWWLNANKIALGENAGEAIVEAPTATLDARVVYPAVEGKYIPDFRGDDGVEYPPHLSAGYAVHKRVYFKTEKTEQTKLVTILGVRRSEAAAHEYTSEKIGDCLKLVFEGDKRVYVNLADNSSRIMVDGFEFVGKAIAVSDSTAMLVEGKSLKADGKLVVSFEDVASAIVGLDELGIATVTDNKMTVGEHNRYVTSIDSIAHFDGNVASAKTGVEYTRGDGTLEFTLEGDFYELMLNGKETSSSVEPGSLTVTLDGNTKKYEMRAKKQRNGKELFTFTKELPLGKYEIVSKNEELSVKGFDADRAAAQDITVFSGCAENYLVMKSVELKCAEAQATSDYDGIKACLDAFSEAEDYVGKKPNAVSVYSTRSFLSGGKGVKLLDTVGDRLGYKIDIPEDGEYDFIVKYVAWNPDGAEKLVTVDGDSYKIHLERTDGYGTTPDQWKACRAKLARHMSAGTHTVYLEAFEGEWNIDWLGFIKK